MEGVHKLALDDHVREHHLREDGQNKNGKTNISTEIACACGQGAGSIQKARYTIHKLAAATRQRPPRTVLEHLMTLWNAAQFSQQVRRDEHFEIFVCGEINLIHRLHPVVPKIPPKRVRGVIGVEDRQEALVAADLHEVVLLRREVHSSLAHERRKDQTRQRQNAKL